jgi:hypothetical protein
MLPVARRIRGAEAWTRFRHVEKELLGGARSEPARGRWERGEWWLAGDAKPSQPEAATVISDRLIFRPRTALW